MITITTKSRYGVVALGELARLKTDKPVPIGEIAEKRKIPVQFLEQLFSTLRRAGMLQSQRGVKGGYSFAIDPNILTVLEVVEALDGCVSSGASEGPQVFVDAVEALRSKLANVTIADVAQAEAASGAQMYYI